MYKHTSEDLNKSMDSQEFEETKNEISNEITQNLKDLGVHVSHHKVLNVMMDSVIKGVQKHSISTVPLGE